MGIQASTNADFTIDKGAIRSEAPQDVVITLGQDPVMNPEVACLALTLGQFIRDSGSKVNVTLFLRNDGVSLADKATLGSVSEACTTPMGPVSLEENLKGFIAGNPNNMVNCPICWGKRFGTQEPDYGILKADAIPILFLSADKIIDF
jgi:hypothetical protein